MLARQTAEAMDCLSDFFENIPRFIHRFIENLEGQRDNVRAIAENGLLPLFLEHMATDIDQMLRKAHPAPDGLRTDISTTFLVFGIFGACACYASEDRDELEKCLVDLLTGLHKHEDRKIGGARTVEQSGNEREETPAASALRV